MTDKPENPSAFPNDYAGRVGSEEQYCQYGMTLRDYFASAALQALLQNTAVQKSMMKDGWNAERCQHWHADSAYQFADAMLERRRS